MSAVARGAGTGMQPLTLRAGSAYQVVGFGHFDLRLSPGAHALVWAEGAQQDRSDVHGSSGQANVCI